MTPAQSVAETPGINAVVFFLRLNDRGGAEISMIKIAQGLLGRGRDVTLAVYGSHPGLARELGFTGPVIDLAARRTAGAFLPLYHLLRARRFHSVIAALTHTNIVAWVAAALSRSGARVIATEHGIDGITACRASWLFTALTRLAYARAAAVVAVSEGLAQCWREILQSPAPIIPIYNPVIADNAAEPAPPAHDWLAQKQVPVVIGIGRLMGEKNFPLLIRAFAGLVIKRDARLIILGEGAQRPMLVWLVQELGLSDKVLMPGFSADISAWLPYADLLVSPSQREGFGNAIVEALSYGIPVVATDCPYGPAEILQGGLYGRLVPIDDAAAMTDAIAETLDNAADRQKLRDRAATFKTARCIDLYAGLIDNPALS